MKKNSRIAGIYLLIFMSCVDFPIIVVSLLSKSLSDFIFGLVGIFVVSFCLWVALRLYKIHPVQPLPNGDGPAADPGPCEEGK